MSRYVFLLLFLLTGCGPLELGAPPTTPTPSATAFPTATPTLPSPPTPPAQATALPSATTTTAPTLPPTARPTNTALPRATLAPLPTKVSLNLTHEYQKWNNCGPVSISVVTTYYGIARNQLQVADVVKGFEMDKNVGPSEVVAYFQSVGLRALVRVNGSREQVERLLAAGMPVILHQWLLKPDSELVGHYRVARGYDNGAGVMFFSDPYTGPNKGYGFADVEKWWQPWNNRYIVAYRAEQEPTVRAILSDDFDAQKNYQAALETSQTAVGKGSNVAYELFNIGEDRLALGDAAGAVGAYEGALASGKLLPHFYWYNFGPLEAWFRVGKYQRILDWTTPLLKEVGNVEEIRYWRGRAYHALNQKQKAKEEFMLAVQLNAHFDDAKAMLAAVQ